jgi:hypothetical protein
MKSVAAGGCHMSGEWPADPSDPRCPTCGEPVSATASYCMHCEADLPAAGFGDPESATGTVDDAPMDEADPGMPTRDDDEDDATGAPGGSTTRSLFGTAGERSSRTRAARERAGERADEAAAWLDPDSLLDDVSTLMVAVVTAVVTLGLGTMLTYGLLPSVVDDASPWIALAATAGAGLWVGRTRSVFGAARKAGLVVAGQIALVPVAFVAATSWESVGDAIGGVVVVGIFLWPAAAVVAGVGWVLGLGGVDEEG